MRKAGSKKNLPAQVPGCVHADLLASAEIDNPFFSKNLESVAWVSACEWVYEKTFVSEDFSAFDRVVLRFEGVDTCAILCLNGTVLGHMSNPFETVEFDVKALLKAGKNTVTVTFVPAEGKMSHATFGAIRRTAFNTADEAGMHPASLTAGLWRGVSILAFASLRVKDVAIRQDFSAAGIVGLEVTVATERYDSVTHLEILVRVCYKGNILHEARDILSKDETVLRLAVRNPQLWWPAGLGEQPLYEVTVDILAGRACHEHVSRRIGLRRFELLRGEGNTPSSPGVMINGQRMFVKGASWVPADVYVARMTRVEYARLVKAAAVANMNFLRVWGGGVYESDAFYDLCDEYGICVWQDMMLCAIQSAEPDAAELSAFEREVRCNVSRLRHHPCVAVWCGGDGGGCGIAAAYTQAAEALVTALDPDRPYLPPAAHAPFSLGGGEGAGEPLPAYPEPRVMAGCLNEDERNISHPACAFHVTPAHGARRIYEGFLEQFLMPSGFDNTLWLSQIQQGFFLKRHLEKVRTAAEVPAGFVYWHFNDCWPCCSPSAVDFEGRWKALHYMVRRFFSPLSLCGRYRGGAGLVDIFAFNDGVKKPFKGRGC